MIIWIASYPKSGNTWIRLFLDSLFSSSKEFNINQNYISQFPLRKHFDGLTKDVNNQKHWGESQKKICDEKKIKFLKTHNSLIKAFEYDFTQPKYTLGVVYIIRDPRNVISSMCKS